MNDKKEIQSFLELDLNVLPLTSLTKRRFRNNYGCETIQDCLPFLFGLSSGTGKLSHNFCKVQKYLLEKGILILPFKKNRHGKTFCFVIPKDESHSLGYRMYIEYGDFKFIYPFGERSVLCIKYDNASGYIPNLEKAKYTFYYNTNTSKCLYYTKEVVWQENVVEEGTFLRLVFEDGRRVYIDSVGNTIAPKPFE